MGTTETSLDVTSPSKLVQQLAERYARAVEFPVMSTPDGQEAPVGRIAQRMVDGSYDRAFLVAEVKRLTGVSVELPNDRGRRFLCVIPQHGYWSSELSLMDHVLRVAGYEVDYATPGGGRPWVLGVSLDTSFRDQAWNARQVSAGEASLGRRYEDRNSEEGQRINAPRSLATWLPPTPRPKDGESAREPYQMQVLRGLGEALQYAGMMIVGGSGAYMDLGGNTSIRPIIHLLSALNRPVVGICYGVAVMVQSVDPATKIPLMDKRIATGHSEQDDYTMGTTDVPVEGGYGPDYGSAPFTLEQMVKQYVGTSGGGFVSKDGSPYMAVADGPFITARTTPDGYPAAMLAIAQLHGGGALPKRFVIDGDELGHEPRAQEINA